MEKTVKLVKYSESEERLNYVTHFAGAVLCLIGAVALIVKSVLTGRAQTVAACLIYGASMVTLYLSSGIYHAVKGEELKRLFRIMDHNTIFILIAGTYTPYTLITLNGTIGWLLFGAEWFFAILGIVLNTINLERFKVFSLVCYVAMGWAAVLAIKPLFSSLSAGTFAFLLAGGIAYTVGIYFFSKRKPYYHAIWHIFVLLGTLLQFISVINIF